MLKPKFSHFEIFQVTINDLPVGRDVDETLRLVQAFQFVDEHGEGKGCYSCSVVVFFRFSILKIKACMGRD